MQTSDQGRQLITQREGCRLTPYRGGGKQFPHAPTVARARAAIADNRRDKLTTGAVKTLRRRSNVFPS